ncbi:MAG: lytic transglycosylase domain-containing protein [Thermoanaerobaculales bacterium]|jgi:soluble lytic murein transglycosylase-like protein|nr:lytic transglycosylase domain-containing protein [Thermoanaerobaculales bacterium]
MVIWFFMFMMAVQPAAAGEGLGLESHALAARWDQVLTVATRRESQMALRPEEALIAAHAARLAGDELAEIHFLESAMGDVDLNAVARVELAEAVLEPDPERALDLVLDLLRNAPTTQLRVAALEIAGAAVRAGVGDGLRARLEKMLPSVRHGSRRGVELALAVTTRPVDRHRLSRLLASSTRDLEALAAAEELAAGGALDPVDRWRVAQTFYRHGLYNRAAPLLEALDGVSHSRVPRDEVAYLRGRCAFRREDWPAAAAWYRKAISRTSAGERRAGLEVHLGRTYELAGDLDQAVAAAQRAVRLRTTDDRRLFLARLRLRRDEPDLAKAGLSRLRSRTNRARGELMLGLYELRKGDEDAARRHFSRVSRDPWRGPSVVFLAGLEAAGGDAGAAMRTLDKGAAGLDDYWAGRAREVVRGLPVKVVAEWRRAQDRTFNDPSVKTRRRAMATSMKLEINDEVLEYVRKLAEADVGLSPALESPAFPAGVAARLWSLGLKTSALRWDPAGLPRQSPAATRWTAGAELELGRPWLAISAADAARWQASSLLMPRGLPLDMRRALYPLPDKDLVRKAADRHGLDWTLLAGVAREESRWKPTVVSKVGARGLMQLMPATAGATASANGRPEIQPDDLFEPFISLDLGAAELARLLGVFDGNRAAVMAAYNAGEAQARLWLDQCGDGCTEERYLAGISFSVTRGYTEAVLASDDMYAELAGGFFSE